MTESARSGENRCARELHAVCLKISLVDIAASYRCLHELFVSCLAGNNK